MRGWSVLAAVALGLAGCEGDDSSSASRGAGEAGACPCIAGQPASQCASSPPRRNDAGQCMNCCSGDACGFAPEADGTCLGIPGSSGGACCTITGCGCNPGLACTDAGLCASAADAGAHD